MDMKNSSLSPEVEVPKIARSGTLEVSWFPRWRALFLGYDVFISYRHVDGLGYAMALENQLRGLDLSVFRDVAELPAGTSLHAAIRRALVRSRMLVVVATVGARSPDSWVGWEVETFALTKRPIVAIRFGEETETWPALATTERKWVAETLLSLAPPRPSDNVVQEINNSRQFIRRNFLGRALLIGIVMCLVVLAGTIWHLTKLKAVETERARLQEANAEAAQRVADARRLAAESETLREQSPSMIPESIASAIRAVEHEDALETDRALRRVVALTPPLHARTRIACTPQIVSWSADALAIVGATGAKNLACIVDRHRARPPRVEELDESPWAAGVEGDLLVIAERDVGKTGRLILEDTWTGKKRCPPVPGDFKALAIAGDGTRVVAVDAEGSVMSIDPRSCKRSPLQLEPSMRQAPSTEWSIDFDPESNYLIVTSSKVRWVFRLSETTAKLVIRQSIDESKHVGRLAARPIFDPQKHLLVLTSDDKVEGYSLPEGARRWSWPSPPIAALAIAGDALLMHDTLGHVVTVSLQHMRADNTTHPISGEPILSGVHISHDARDVLTHEREAGRVSSTIQLWDRLTGQEVSRLFHTNRIVAVIDGIDGDAYLTVGQDQEVRYWGDVHREEVEIAVPQGIDAFAVEGEHVLVAYGGWCKTCRRISVWNSRTGALEREVAFAEPVIALSLRGNKVVAATTGGVFSWRWADTQNNPLQEGTWPFHASAVTMTNGSARFAVAAIDGKGNGVLYRAEQWMSPEKFGYRNPVWGGDLEPWSSQGLVLRGDAEQVAVAVTGAVTFGSLGGVSGPEAIPTDYRIHTFAFAPQGNWIALASAVKPADPSRNPIPALEIVWQDRLTRTRVELAADGFNAAVAVSPSGDRIAVAVGRILQIRGVPNEGDLPEMVLKQIELPWVIHGASYAGPGEIWVWGDYRIRRIRLDSSALMAEARRRLGDLLPATLAAPAPKAEQAPGNQ